MSDRVQVDWSVPTEAWERFRKHVRSEYGSLEGHLSREVECAMAEYSRTDGYEPVEDLVDRLVQAAGRTLGDSPREKNSTNTFGAETTRARPWVDETILEEFKHEADEDRGSYGRVLAKALRAYREGGRAARLRDKLERIVDDAERLLETVRDDEGSSMGKKERQTVAICSDLPSPFNREWLESKIEEYAGDSDYYISEYTEAVTERLGPLKVVERPDEPDLFLTPEQWRSRVLADVIDDLGGDPTADSCPAFSRSEVGEAVVRNASGVESDDHEQINDLVESLLDRLGFVWDDEREVYDSQRRPAQSEESTAERATDHTTDAIDEEFATLESTRRVATDGGTTRGDPE